MVQRVFAVAGIVADVVGKAGLAVFSVLWLFFVTVLSGLLLHAVVWYPTFAWVVGGVSPVKLFRYGFDAIVTAISCNSWTNAPRFILQAMTRTTVKDEDVALWAMERFFRDGNREISERVRALRKEVEREFGTACRAVDAALGPLVLWTTRGEARRFPRGRRLEPGTFVERRNWLGAETVSA